MTGRRTGLMAWGIAAAVMAIGAAASGAGIRINTTASLPRGLWLAETPSQPLRVGDVALFCPPDTPAVRLARDRHYLGAGACPGDFEPMQKPIAAVAGDVVRVAPAGVAINDQAVPSSAVYGVDGAGRSLPSTTGTLTVPPGEVWLLSTYNAHSYDSRYIGPVPARLVSAVMVPLWTEARR